MPWLLSRTQVLKAYRLTFTTQKQLRLCSIIASVYDTVCLGSDCCLLSCLSMHTDTLTSHAHAGVTQPLRPQGRFWVQGPSASPATLPDASIWCSGCALVFIAQGKGGLGGQDWVASNERVAGCGTVLPSAQLAERARPQAASAQTHRRWCELGAPDVWDLHRVTGREEIGGEPVGQG